MIPGPKNKTGTDKDDTKKRRTKRDNVAVVHAYGIGPAGFQASLGIAEKASELADDWLQAGRREGVSVRSKL